MARKTTFQPQNTMATKKGNREALLAALATIEESGVREEEFLLTDFIHEANEAGKSMTVSGAQSAINRLVRSGFLIVRKTRVNGKITNAYSKA